MRLLCPQTLEEEILLFKTAHKKRIESVGPRVHVRGIIEFSNYCRQECLYCGLRRVNPTLARYRMSPEEMIQAASRALSVHRFGTFVLQSGEDPGYPKDELCDATEEIKRMGPAVTLSVGQMPKQDYELWKDSAADRFLLKFETSDPVLFRKLKPTTTLYERLECIKHLQELVYQVGSGIILGLPGQDLESVASDLLLMRRLDLEMVSIGPFIPHPDTPLGSMSIANPIETIRSTLRTIAVARLMVPMAHIPATTALGVVSKNVTEWEPLGKLYASEIIGMVPKYRHDARSLALLCGANVIMPGVTPRRFRGSYQIYPGKGDSDGEGLAFAVRMTKDLITSVGLSISETRGDSPKPPWRGV